MESHSETTQTVSALKLPVLKTRDYDLWSMRMEQYLTHPDYALLEVIVNDVAPAITSASTEGLIPPKTAKQKLARKNELKAKSTLLLAIPDEHLLKFYGIKDAKTLWEAIKTRSEGLDKTYDRFQKLISQLEIHGEIISQEDANLKLLRSLPLAWNNIALIMRNKSDLDTMSMDDLYNNLKVYEAKIKSQSSSSLNSQNVAFVSSENTSSTNEAVNTAHEVSTANSHGQASSSSYADDVMFSFFVSQSNSQQLDNEDLNHIDTDDLEEMDLKWQVAMLTMRVKRFLKKIGRNLNFNGKETVGFDKTKVECYNCHRRGHFARECRAPQNQGNRNGDVPRRIVPIGTPANALVVQDGICGYDWSFQAEEGPTDFALMAYLSQKEQLKKYNLEIMGYQLGLESLEARIVIHKKNEAVYEEDIEFLKYDVKNSILNGSYEFKEIDDPGNPEARRPTGKRKQTLADLNETERKQVEANIKAVNLELMEGTELTKQEQETKLVDEFDEFTLENGESIQTYYLRFSKMMNDMIINGIEMSQIQVNIKFLNHLQPEWKLYVTVVKQTNDLHKVNYDQLFAYLNQNQDEANEIQAERATGKAENVGNYTRNAGNATGYAGNVTKDAGNAIYVRNNVISTVGDYENVNAMKVIKCNNCKGTIYYARQCTKKKRVMHSTWFRDKMLLAKNEEAGIPLEDDEHRSSE
ncbi:ribonuclease H-like domain-containing protein [Tanacetum coccineum]